MAFFQFISLYYIYEHVPKDEFKIDDELYANLQLPFGDLS